MRSPAASFLPTTRREFLRLSSRGIGLLAFGHFAPDFLVQSVRAGTPQPEKDVAFSSWSNSPEVTTD